MPKTSQAERRLLMYIDMENYSRHGDAGQARAQASFRRIMRRAADLCGLDRDEWEIQPAGDGELAIFPSGVDEPRVVADLAPALDQVLRDHNAGAAGHAQVRLRMALHQGLITRTKAGYAGTAVVAVARLVDASPLRRALAVYSDAGVALIVSADLYRDVVRQGYRGIRSDRYRRVEVDVKSFTGDAWIFVPDENVNTLADLDAPAPPADAPAPPADAPAPPADAARGAAAAGPPGGGSRYVFNGSSEHIGTTIYGDYASVAGGSERDQRWDDRR